MEKDIRLCACEDCVGCMACKQKCPKNAITLKEIEGFWYPNINDDECCQCGVCMNVCPVLNIRHISGNTHKDEKKCVAAWNIDDNIRLKSSSGGSFSAMAEYILSQGGVVFGAAWDTDMNLLHRSINNVSELDLLRRSKYVQSNIGDTYNEVLRYLNSGIKVLYCGTPCQIAGLSAFLGYKDYENLFKVDVICQGVPSPLIFKKYLQEIETECDGKIIDVNFRSKNNGWGTGFYQLFLHVQKGSKDFWIKKRYDDNIFYNAFYKEYFMRRSCYHCNFKNNKLGYYSDISIADFWRIGNEVPLNVKKYSHGISAVVINTEKGNAFFKTCSIKLVTIERTWAEFSTNGGLRSSIKRLNNDAAYEYLRSHSWTETQNKFFPYRKKEKIKSFVILFLGEEKIRFLKKLIGKIK